MLYLEDVRPVLATFQDRLDDLLVPQGDAYRRQPPAHCEQGCVERRYAAALGGVALEASSSPLTLPQEKTVRSESLRVFLIMHSKECGGLAVAHIVRTFSEAERRGHGAVVDSKMTELTIDRRGARREIYMQHKGSTTETCLWLPDGKDLSKEVWERSGYPDRVEHVQATLSDMAAQIEEALQHKGNQPSVG